MWGRGVEALKEYGDDLSVEGESVEVIVDRVFETAPVGSEFFDRAYDVFIGLLFLVLHVYEIHSKSIMNKFDLTE